MSRVLCFVAILFFLVSHLQMVIAGVWITSALYSIPKFIFSRTITNIHLNGVAEEICIMDRAMFNSKLLDSINLSALYLLPLLVMTVSDSNECVICVWSKSWKFHENTNKRTNDGTSECIVCATFWQQKSHSATIFNQTKNEFWLHLNANGGRCMVKQFAARVPQISNF